MSVWLPNDDHTDVSIVRPSSYGWAQADPEHKSRRKKRPIGFVMPDPPDKPRRRAAKPSKEKG